MGNISSLKRIGDLVARSKCRSNCCNRDQSYTFVRCGHCGSSRRIILERRRTN